jgi:hypothetical protein
VTYEIDKLKESHGELSRAAEERDRLSDTLRKKTQEIEKLHN